MKGARGPREARRIAHAAIVAASAPPTLEEDVRRVKADGVLVEEFVAGAVQRGFTDEEIGRLTALVGVTWAKAAHGEPPSPTLLANMGGMRREYVAACLGVTRAIATARNQHPLEVQP